MIQALRVARLIAASLVLASCGVGTSADNEGSNRSIAPTIIVNEDYPLNGTCSDPDEVVELIQTFLGTAAEGDAEEIRDFFPKESANLSGGSALTSDSDVFQVYSVVYSAIEQNAFVAYERESAVSHILERQRQNEVLQLEEAIILPYYDMGQAQFRLVRQADDLSTQKIAGRTWVNCANDTIVFWSMGAQAD